MAVLTPLPAVKLGITETERKYLIATYKSLVQIQETSKPIKRIDGVEDIGFYIGSFVEDHPNEERNPECKTTFCFAGWMVLHAVGSGKIEELRALVGDELLEDREIERIDQLYGDPMEMGSVANRYADYYASERLRNDSEDGDGNYHESLFYTCSGVGTVPLAVERLRKFLETGSLVMD